ncbi:MAG: hypothetical protein JSR82_11265 [Verrucomicrobia bacterium]|nr:hypothetical protein [Verrucomicrobiota bacterium]
MKIITCVASVGLVFLAGAEPPKSLNSLEDPRVVTVVALSGDLESARTFRTSNREPLLVADLGGEKTIRRISTTYRGPAARVEFFLFDATAKIDFKKNDFDVLCADIKSIEQLFTTAPEAQRRPVASVLVQRANESVQLRRFFAPTTGRFVVVTFSRQTRDQGSGGAGEAKLTLFDAGASDPGTGPTPDIPVVPPLNGIPPISR